MAATTEVPHRRTRQREPAVKEVHILWTPDGLGCDGDTISTTAATQPSIEDIVLGAIPGLPITLCEWIDRLAPRAWAVVAAGTCATYGGIHAMAGNPTGCMGLADYLGWNWRSKAGIPIVNVPGCPVQPDNMTETLLYLLY